MILLKTHKILIFTQPFLSNHHCHQYIMVITLFEHTSFPSAIHTNELL